MTVFAEIYAPYLEGFSQIEIEEIKGSISVDLFTASSTSSNSIVKKAAEDFKKNQKRAQLFELWREKTCGTKNPRAWSAKYQTPILCCVPADLYGEAKKAFSTINSTTHSESDIVSALAFIESTTIWDDLGKAEYRDAKFMEVLVGEYAAVLPDIATIRETLDKVPVDPYDWSDSPVIREKIKSMANAEYYAGGSDKALDLIEGMSADELKQHLKSLVQKDIELGIKLIVNGRK